MQNCVYNYVCEHAIEIIKNETALDMDKIGFLNKNTDIRIYYKDFDINLDTYFWFDLDNYSTRINESVHWFSFKPKPFFVNIIDNKIREKVLNVVRDVNVARTKKLLTAYKNGELIGKICYPGYDKNENPRKMIEYGRPFAFSSISPLEFSVILQILYINNRPADISEAEVEEYKNYVANKFAKVSIREVSFYEPRIKVESLETYRETKYWEEWQKSEDAKFTNAAENFVTLVNSNRKVEE